MLPAFHANRTVSFGTGFLICFLPVLVYALAFFVNDVSGSPPPSLLHPSTVTIETLKADVGWPENGFKGLFDGRATLYVLGYYLLSLVLQIVVPGKEVEGVVLACGGRHKYKFNGM